MQVFVIIFKSKRTTARLRDLKIMSRIGVARIFDWGRPKPQIRCNDVIRNFKREFFCRGKDIVEWKIRSGGLVLARNWELFQAESLDQQLKCDNV